MKRSDRQLREIAYLWSIGRLAYLLHEGQSELRKQFYETSTLRFVLNCGRRWGKSWWLCVMALECALGTENARVWYAAPTAKMVRTIIEPTMRKLLRECPEHLRPAYYRQEGVWRFPNGSEIHVAGCDNGGADRLRGNEAHLALIDEAGMIADLEYLIEDVFSWTTITTGGRILIASTPATTPAHPFRAYCDAAQLDGSYAHRTLYDAPHIDTETADRYVMEAGGPQSSTARRECFAEHVIDEEEAIIPEFTRCREAIVIEPKLPDYFIPYVLADGGFHDLWATIFAYWDFPAHRYVIVDELVVRRKNPGEVIPQIRAKEMGLWGRAANPRRYGDFTPLERSDLAATHGMAFAEVLKPGKHEAVNLFRVDCAQGHVAIHPRCVSTIQHAEAGVWNRGRTDFERPGGPYGHFDALAALIYLARVVDRQENPFPTLIPGTQLPGMVIPRNVIENERLRKMRHAFGGSNGSYDS